MIRLALLISTVVLGSCGNPNQSTLLDYLNRLDRVLDTESQIVPTALPLFPKPRDLTFEQDTGSISIREFLSMRQCELHTALAEKNSLMGKLATSSQTLIIDLKILELGPDCVAQLTEDQQINLAKKLDEELTLKSKTVHQRLWQALLGEQENRQFWRGQNTPDDYPNTVNHQVEDALEKLLRFSHSVLQGEYQLASELTSELEINLAALRQGDGGHLLVQIADLSDGLSAANQAIAARLTRPLCLSFDTNADSGLQPVKQPTAAVGYFRNVVNSVFIAEIQPHSVALTQRYRQLMPSYLELETTLMDHAPPAYQQWAATRQTILSEALSAPKQHVAAIQALYSQCGLQPG